MSLVIDRVLSIPTHTYRDRDKTEYDISPVTDVALVPTEERIDASDFLQQTSNHLWVTAQSGLHVFSAGGTRLWSLNGSFTCVQRARDSTGDVYVVRAQRDLFREANQPWLDRDSFYDPVATSAHPQSGSGDLRSLALTQNGEKIIVGHSGTHLSQYAYADTETPAQHQLGWRKSTRLFSAWQVATADDNEHFYALNTSGGSQIVCKLDMGKGDVVCSQRLPNFASRLVVLPEQAGVVLAVNERNRAYHVQVLTADLRREHWRISFDRPITAMCADSDNGNLVVGIGRSGQLVQIDVAAQAIVAQSELLHARIESVDSIQGGAVIAAGTYVGGVFYLSNPNLVTF